MRIWNLFKKKEPEKRFMLSLDGGGMRGVIPVRILMELEGCLREHDTDVPLADMFDLVAGTSTGGLIALALTCTGQSLDQIMTSYRESGPSIFPRQTPSIGSALRSTFRTLTSEKYPADGLENLLRQWFGDSKLSSACTKTMIMAYDLSRGREFEMCSWEDLDITAFEAARATSAAPTYFSPLQYNGELLVDGGVIANNPSLFALSMAQRLWPDCRNFTILSIGTAGAVHTMKQDSAGGILNWVDNVVPMYSTAQKRTVDRILGDMAGVHYLRIEDSLAEKINMDDSSQRAMEIMTVHAENLAAKRREDLAALAGQLAANRGNG